MDKRNKKKGFTLIEMIVVVAIIAILAGIAVPQVTKQLKNSKKNADVATAKVIAGAMQQYLAEGNTIQDQPTITPINITNNNPINFSNYIDNASSLSPKMSSGYHFSYTYNSSSNTIEIYAGSGEIYTPQSGQTKNCYKLYPTLDSDYK